MAKLDNELIEKINSYGDEVSSSVIANELGIGKTSVLKYRGKITTEIKDVLKQDTYTEDIEKKTAKIELEIIKKKYWEALLDIENKEKMYEVFDKVRNKRNNVKIEKKIWEEQTQSIANLVFSDLHAEEVVDIDTINWLNEYNPQIAKSRSEKMFIRFVEVLQSLKKSENIHWVILHLLWDFMTWYIHPELIENNAMSPTETVLFVKSIISSWINYILDNTDENIVVATAFGNHWRTTDKKRISTGWKNSYEWMMYNIIAEHYLDNPRVQFKIEKWNLNYINVYDKVMCDMHGDMIKYQWWVGWITIPMNKAIWQRQKAKHADLYNVAHRHQLRDWWAWITNGSVIGYNNYAESIKADYEEPKQLMYLFNSKYGKTINSPIVLI